MLKRINFNVRKTKIGQKVPDNWQEKATVNTEALRRQILAAGVDVIINVDQKFVQFYPERQYVIETKIIRRVGRKVKENENMGSP